MHVTSSAATKSIYRLSAPVFVLCSLATLANVGAFTRDVSLFPMDVVPAHGRRRRPLGRDALHYDAASTQRAARLLASEARLTLLALAPESLLRAVTTYNRGWCDVPARAASTTMCDALVATWIARAIVAVVCLISFGRALQMACWGEPPVAARAFRVSVCMHACFFVIVHLCVWGAILLLGKEGDDFSATRVCLAVIVGANDGVLGGLGVRRCSEHLFTLDSEGPLNDTVLLRPSASFKHYNFFFRHRCAY